MAITLEAIPIETQPCKVCGEEKPLNAFEKQKDRPSHRTTCKSCRNNQRDKEKERLRHREYMKERRQSNPDTLRINWERSRYGKAKEDIGITSCLICSSTERLCIDHDHSTGEIRGILCSKCNSGLGLFKDNKILLQNAINYLTLDKT